MCRPWALEHGFSPSSSSLVLINAVISEVIRLINVVQVIKDLQGWDHRWSILRCRGTRGNKKKTSPWPRDTKGYTRPIIQRMCHSHVIPHIIPQPPYMSPLNKSVTVARLKAMMTEKKVSSVVAGVMSDRPTPNWAKAQFLDSDVFRKSAGDAGGCLLTSCDIRKNRTGKYWKHSIYYYIYILCIYIYIYILQIENDHCWIVDVGFQVETQLQFAMLQGSAEHLDWAQP